MRNTIKIKAIKTLVIEMAESMKQAYDVEQENKGEDNWYYWHAKGYIDGVELAYNDLINMLIPPRYEGREVKTIVNFKKKTIKHVPK